MSTGKVYVDREGDLWLDDREKDRWRLWLGFWKGSYRHPKKLGSPLVREATEADLADAGIEATK